MYAIHANIEMSLGVVLFILYTFYGSVDTGEFEDVSSFYIRVVIHIYVEFEFI